MFKINADLKYTPTHEWVRKEKDYIVVGITDCAQHLLGDIVYIDMDNASNILEKDKEVVVVESVKAASSVYSPVNGMLVVFNTILNDSPELINTDPYGNGWIFKAKVDNITLAWENLLSSNDYQKLANKE
ncbi:glycine cleavage system H protein [Candidatus Xenohaliotis californiensis]|uniref:Glycine cleavage system H protein n=1 Tax=Candidatus Xenohaliotis californiensis TaxID=84677 RepID=A0ABM9N9B6_9RICK|nr:glycine cleavage system H protein [Candidatus Xenohaliotis californiensis]